MYEISHKEAVSYGESNRSLNLIALFVGFGLYVHHRLGVRFSLAELFIPIFILGNVSLIPEITKYREVRWLAWGAFASCAATVCSDFYHQVTFIEFAKGIGKPIFLFAFLIFFLILFMRSAGTLFWFIVGMFAGSIVHLIWNTGDDDFNYSGYGSEYTFFVYRVTPLLYCVGCLLAFTTFKRSKWFPGFLNAVLGLIALRYGARASAFALIASSGLMAYMALPSAIKLSLVVNPLKYSLRYLVILVGLGFASIFLYKYLASNGYLGDRVQSKYYSQAGDGSVASLFLRGRTDALGCLLMIADNPIIGHGSVSYRVQYFVEAARIAGDRGSAFELGRYGSGLTNMGHSIILSNFANAGFLTLIYWIVSLIIVAKMTIMLVSLKDRSVCLLLVFIITFAWDAFFSPLSVQMRAIIPMITAFAVVVITRVNDEMSEAVE